MKLSKTYDPKKYEDLIYKLWETSGSFKPKHRGNKQRFSMVMPPPNANANIHLGTAITLDLEDIAIRYNRMLGKATLYLPGADHAGFETQSVYEKHLANKGKSRFDYSRKDLYDQIWDFVDQNKTKYQTQFRQLGVSCDWDTYTYTLDNKIVDRVYKTFKKMWDENLVYRGERIVNFCTYHGTGFADIEVSYKESKGHLWYIKYPLTDGSGEIVVATTRPETMLGDTAVAVHPEDKRYTKFVGKTVKLPLTHREIPIIADDYVDRKYGTGAVKITPAHDPNDFDMAERHDLPNISVIGHDGLITHDAPEDFIGLDVTTAREKVVNTLVDQDYLQKREDINHSVGHCYKCGTVIEPLLREQWFIDMQSLALPAIKALKAKEIKFYPDTKRTQLIKYLEGLKDWNISRQIAWGIPIPAFQSADDPEVWVFDNRINQETISVNGKKYHRDPDVFDTWFSSSSWPYATLDFPNGDNFKQNYPLDLMETGGEIIYPWVSRMIMLGLYITGEVPFKSVYIHGYVMAEDGSKMSKSIGNVVDPIPVIKEYGSDALRMGLISGRQPAVNRGYDPRRITDARNFCNKLWNIARFIQEQLGPEDLTNPPTPNTYADHWMLTKLQQLTEKITKDIDNYRFSEAYDKIYHFVWDDFADWYIEASKTTQNGALLKFGLESILKICHPFAPFVTEAIWKELEWSNELLITSAWPIIPDSIKTKANKFDDMKNMITEIRQMSKAMQLSKPTLLHQAAIIGDNEELITRLARVGEIKLVDKGRGLQLKSVKQNVWLDISDEILNNYTKLLKEKLDKQKNLIENLESRLKNKAYVKNAPPKVVEDTKQSLKESLVAFNLLTDEISRL